MKFSYIRYFIFSIACIFSNIMIGAGIGITNKADGFVMIKSAEDIEPFVNKCVVIIGGPHKMTEELGVFVKKEEPMDEDDNSSEAEDIYSFDIFPGCSFLSMTFDKDHPVSDSWYKIRKMTPEEKKEYMTRTTKKIPLSETN